MTLGLEFRTHSEPMQGRSLVIKGHEMQVILLASADCVLGLPGDGSAAGPCIAAVECRIVPIGLKVEGHGREQTFLIGRR